MDLGPTPAYVARARVDLARYGATPQNGLDIASGWALDASGEDAAARALRLSWLRQLAREHDLDPGVLAGHHTSRLAELRGVVMNGTLPPSMATNGPTSVPGAGSSPTHDEVGLIRVLTLADLYAAADEEIPWLLEGVIPGRGVTTLVGASGSGKTHFDRAFLRGLVAGHAAMGGLALPGTAMPVLLVSEWPQALLGTKLRESWGPDSADLPLHVITARIGLAAWESAARMVDDLIRRQRRVEYGLIEIDTMRTFARLRDENDNAELSRVMSEFARLADEGVPVRLSHHTAKSAGPRTSPQIACAGAHAIPSLSTQTVSLWRKAHSTAISLWSAGDLIETKHDMRWDEESGLFLPSGQGAQPPEVAAERADERVLAAAAALASDGPDSWHSKAALQREMGKAGGLRREDMNRAIDRLSEAGELGCNREHSNPRYRSTQVGGGS